MYRSVSLKVINIPCKKTTRARVNTNEFNFKFKFRTLRPPHPLTTPM